ncbi:MAG: hypothetical protein EOO20_06115 [Chryseobacterium sp.]|nr:MAG: hypothetical protein EOO20_06115 [Chryseobacterium sp.]
MNRKVIILALTTLLLSVSLFTFYSCNKNPAPGECGYGPTILKAEVQKEIVFPNDIKKTISFLSLDEYKERPDATVHSWVEASTSSSELAQILNGFGITDINNKEKLITVIAYYNSDKEAYTLKNENVYGFLVLTYDDKGYMYTQVFQKKGTSFEHLKQFDSKIWKIYFEQRNNIAKILTSRNTNLGYAVWIGNNESTYQQATKGSDNSTFQHQIDKELKLISTLKMSVSLRSKFETKEHMDFESGCTTSECKVTGKGKCGAMPGSGTPICDQDRGAPGMCGGKTSYSVASVTNDYAMTQTVTFRDSLLTKTDFGKHFIKDLEYVGYIFEEHLTVSDAVNIVAVMDAVIVPLAAKLNSPTVSSDYSLFIPASDATTLQNLITQMRGVSSDALYQEILDEMAANVTYIQGKTTHEVYLDLLPS